MRAWPWAKGCLSESLWKEEEMAFEGSRPGFPEPEVTPRDYGAPASSSCITMETASNGEAAFPSLPVRQRPAKLFSCIPHAFSLASYPVSSLPPSLPPSPPPRLSSSVERVSTGGAPLMTIAARHSWLHLPSESPINTISRLLERHTAPTARPCLPLSRIIKREWTTWREEMCISERRGGWWRGGWSLLSLIRQSGWREQWRQSSGAGDEEEEEEEGNRGVKKNAMPMGVVAFSSKVPHRQGGGNLRVSRIFQSATVVHLLTPSCFPKSQRGESQLDSSHCSPASLTQSSAWATPAGVRSIDGAVRRAGLVQRCVIIQKDENGFGLTVSGDNPVFVQLVKEDGAAMRAGVQTGDRIIKVNGTLVTHSNHVEVVELIKSGSYVALTVLGRPPGLAQIPLSEGEGDGGPVSSLSSPHSPGPTAAERSTSTSPSDRVTSPLPVWEEKNPVYNQKVDILQKMLTKEQQELQDGSLSPKLLEGEVEDGGGLGNMDPLLPWQPDSNTESSWSNNTLTPVTPSPVPESPYQREPLCHSPKSTPRDSLNSCPSPDADDAADLDSNSQSSVGSPSSRLPPHIIGAEDDDFDTEQEQMNGQWSCFQTVELLKSRPAHLAAFLHHVLSQFQFDPAPLLCYLYAELYKHSSSKETRRLFLDIHTFFMDRTAHLKVVVPDSISADLDRRRLDLIPEDVQRQYVQQLQEALLPDIQKHLEDFRQKRSMGLTLAEAELTRLDTERLRDRVALERERSCAEHIMVKLEDMLSNNPPNPCEELPNVTGSGCIGILQCGDLGAPLAHLAEQKTSRGVCVATVEDQQGWVCVATVEDQQGLPSSATEEEKCTTMQYVILSYMKHLGVKVKESRGLEPKPKRINFLPKIKVEAQHAAHRSCLHFPMLLMARSRPLTPMFCSVHHQPKQKTIRAEKDSSVGSGGVEEKVKKPRFHSILSRPSRIDTAAITKAIEQNKPRPQKQPPQTAPGPAEPSDPPLPPSARTRGAPLTAAPEAAAYVASPPHSAPATQGPDSGPREPDTGGPPSAMLRLGDSAPPIEGQDSASSGTHFDFSSCALDHQEEELEAERILDGGTPRPLRRMEPLSSGEVQSEDDQGTEVEAELDPPHWQTLVSRDVLAQLPPHEIKRQEVINELFYTERAHLRMLKVLENVFYQRMSREAVLPPGDIKNIFTNLEEIVLLHASIMEQMTAVRKNNDAAVIDVIGDDLLSWFSGAEEEKIKLAAGTFCSNQPFALELIKSRQKKDQRFASFVQEAESNRQCRRLQLKDIIPVEMQRLTKYPLLLENIAKYTDDAEEKSKVKLAGECCRKILNHVNQEVKEAENKQRLEDYQRRLDLSSLKQSEYPMIAEFKAGTLLLFTSAT
ncbi:hypothetical protein P4O66_016052 [Electrophorus voltai]|uniref:Rho guanine nucleotide exchange factor (GEF) 12a n=1 Tax=Electrophorus voltai TaxID=2609070 RepID=A0AAD9DMW1_9TELE|nr:hypothetical protein P4O66_016052 [Electrophorus voltai]